MTYSRVLSVSEWQTPDIVEIEVLCFAAGVKEIMRVASSQLIYIDRPGWAQAGSMSFGAVMINSAFGNNICSSVRQVAGVATVFELELEEGHTFYIGDSETWVSQSAEA